jgi:cobalt transporter subunit CbtB
MKRDTAKVKAVPRSHEKAHDRVADVWPVFAAILLGVFILYGIGFAGADVLHNAAHDSRHAITFPCH